MTCYYPNNAHVVGTKPDGKKILHFGLPKSADHEGLLLPCGQCVGCRLDKSIQWAARCMHEAQMHDDNQFITLTYAEEPQFGSLTPHHFTNFMKRYRKAISPEKIRFFHGAEYGDQLNRPHHHACIFGHEFQDREIFSECEGILTYYSESLERLWGHGFCTTSNLTLESAAYVARYCMKKITASDKSQDHHHAHYEKVCETTGEIRSIHPEYATMSRRPGIGAQWYEKFNADIFPHDTTIYKGKNIKTPRYYENLLRNECEAQFQKIKAERRRRADLHAFDNTPARLRVREKVKIASMSNHKRQLHEEQHK